MDMKIPETEKVDFSQLILGFASAALYYAGDSEVEGKNISKKNPALLKQNLEIIKLLKEKSQGNRSEEEEKLITEILAQLEVSYRQTFPDKQ